MSFTLQCGSSSLHSRPNGFQVPRQPPYMQHDPFKFCVFCWTSNHPSHQCEKFNNSKSFWNIVLEDRRCKNCLRLFHQSHKCYDRNFCHLVNCRRQDKHSPVLCRIRYWKGNFGNRTTSSRGSFVCSENNSSLMYHENNIQHSKFHHLPPVKLHGRHFQNRRDDKFRRTKDKSCQAESQYFCKNSVSTQIEFVSNNFDAGEKITRSCQTENPLVSKVVQTSLQIPPATDIYQFFPLLPGHSDYHRLMEKRASVSNNSDHVSDVVESKVIASYTSHTHEEIEEDIAVSSEKIDKKLDCNTRSDTNIYPGNDAPKLRSHQQPTQSAEKGHSNETLTEFFSKIRRFSDFYR